MKKFRIVTVLLALCLITSSFVGGTFAKYTSTVTDTDSAVVAKWSIEYQNKTDNGSAAVDIAVENPTIVFNLFNTVCDINTEADDGNVKNADDADADTAQIIAPGTSGSFQFTITNTSEVTAEYTVTLTAESTNNNVLTNNGTVAIPIQYSLDKSTWKDDISELDITGTLVYEEDTAASGTHTVYWRWCFEGTANGAFSGQTNDNDTKLGIAADDNQTATPTVTVTATINVEQVN